MKKLCAILVGLCVFFGMESVASAQQSKPPKILTITREFVKPGKYGSAHDKAESMFVSAFAAAKWPTHYLAMDSMTGKPRSLFFAGYDSFEAWEKDGQAQQKNASLSSALDRATETDGSLLDSTETSAFYFSEEQSFNPSVDIAHMRFFEIASFKVRPGHDKDWSDAVKLVKEAYAKGIPDAHWAMYQAVYGAPGGTTYIVITPMKSMAEIDTEFTNNSKFMAAMGTDGMKKLDELSARAIEDTTTNLFVFSPKKSYVQEEWIKADPEFWKPKAPAAAAKKMEQKKD